MTELVENRAPAAEQPVESTALATRAVGLIEVAFQSIAMVGPAGGIALALGVGAGFAGGAEPLSVVLAGLAVLLVGNSLRELSRHLPSATGMITYIARGIHPSVGFVAGLVLAFGLPCTLPLAAMLFGTVTAGVFNTEFGWSFDTWWIPMTLACIIGVTIIAYFGIRLNTKVLFIAGTFEIVVFMFLSFWLIVDAGSANTLQVFGTHYATVPGFVGISGVFAGSVYVILAFVGFESAVSLAEEAKEPRRQVGTAVVIAAIVATVIYLTATYASAVYFGPAKYMAFGQFGGGSPWIQVATDVWHKGWILVFLTIANSLFAASLAVLNTSSRTWYGLGRQGLLPSVLGRTHPTRKSPVPAQVAVCIFSVIGALWLGLEYGPVTGFTLFSTIAVIVLVAIYMLVNLSCIVFYWRDHHDEFNPIRHFILPVVGIAAFVPVFCTAAGIKLFSFVSALPYPINRSGPVIGIVLLVALIYWAYLLKERPGKVAGAGRVFEEEEVVSHAL